MECHASGEFVAIQFTIVNSYRFNLYDEPSFLRKRNRYHVVVLLFPHNLEQREGTLFSSEALPVLYNSCWYASFNRTGNIKPFRRHLCDCLNDLFKMKFKKQRKHDENFFRTCVAVLHCFVRIDVTLRELLCSEKGAV